MNTILFVDDSPDILSLYRRIFERSPEWRCYYVEDAESAMGFLSTISIDILVSDLEMPFVNGVQLLKMVKQEYPDVVRIIISGATLNESHLDVVRLAHRFFRKPSHIKAIRDAIEHTFFVQNLLIGRKARTLLGNIETIPAYPFVIEQIEKEINSSEGSLKNVGKIIAKDPGLTSNILKLVNSDYFDFANEIVSPEHAVTMIGIEGIKGVILTQVMFEEIPEKLFRTFNIEHFRDHCLLTAQFSKMIAEYEKLPSSEVETAFVTGLLHDIGRLVLDTCFTDAEVEIHNYLKELHGEGDLAALEKANIGVSHSQAGAYLLGLWGVQNSVIEPILLHHTPSHFSGTHYPKLTSVLHCADQFAYSLMPKCSIDGIERLDKKFLMQHLSEDTLNSWRDICSNFVNTKFSK